MFHYPVDTIGGDFTFAMPSQHFNAADAYSRLPDSPDVAERAARDAITAYADATPEEANVENQALSHVSLALARARSNDLEGVRDALLPVFDLATGFLINPIVGRAVGRVHQVLIDPRYAASPVARDLVAEAEQIMRSSSALPT